RTAAQAIGYKELLDAPDGVDAAFDLAIRRTRRFARRQRMWFRRDPRIAWLGTGGNPCSLLPALLATWRR
ncbi:MAG TPA: tRNA (adenosine(37)-N6)-dimethylallyltransferase MiaA, partial [Acidimicrobiia bacterium]|nr:tRNA (adenosine(37)-N6)-dimethylallyltransferase MiaA [Acidimicrobiia bacterium]